MIYTVIHIVRNPFGFQRDDFPSGSSYFIFAINVGNGRIRHRTTLNFIQVIFNRFGVHRDRTSIIGFIIQNPVSDRTPSGNDFKN